jgi:pimeloyl-ACP methyl ester carboxylesterase
MPAATESPHRTEVDLPAGRIRYRDEGSGKPIVFVHGYLVDSRLWDGVVDALGDRCRCLAPDWPIGSQQMAMKPDTDLSPYGIAATIADFLEELDLEDVTIVGNDSGGAMSQVLATQHPERIGRLVLTNCDTHENFPPGPFKAFVALAKLPGGLRALLAPLRFDAVARTAYRPFTKKPIPTELIRSWVEPWLNDSRVRHDVRKVTVGMEKRYTIEAAERLSESDLPVLLAWAPRDKVFPLKFAERLAGEVPNARIVEIPDAGTFVPFDQPQRLADEIAAFIA